MKIAVFKRVVQLIIIASFPVVISGCLSHTFGSMPLTDRLGQLELGQSERADVLLVLGEPRGEGAAEFIQQSGRPREAWYYEYWRSESTMFSSKSTVKGKTLVVFFENEKYDGYMWFSALVEEGG
jgi:outer membrane protein assembly factor BamE (lipoprotein component of BamABCDE complex)